MEYCIFFTTKSNMKKLKFISFILIVVFLVSFSLSGVVSSQGFGGSPIGTSSFWILDGTTLSPTDDSSWTVSIATLTVTSAFTLSGVVSDSLDLDGEKFIFDADADSYFQSITDDMVLWTFGSTDVVTMSQDGIVIGGILSMLEQADADADVAGYGQLWVNTATPNELWFTDDAGTDTQLGLAGGTNYNDIGDPTGAGTIVFADTETNLWETASDGESFFVISGTDADLAADTIFLTIQTVDNGDVNFIPFRIIDNSGTPNTLFNISSTGAITTGIWNATAINTTYILDDTILKADFADEDWGDLTVATNVITLDAGVVDATAIATDTITYAQIDDTDQTDTKCIWFENPVAADDFESIWANKTANDFQLTEIWAESDQTVAFDLQIDDGTPADVNGTDITPAAGEAEDTSLSGDTVLAAGEELDLVITSVTNTPTWVSICWTGNWVD